MLKKILSGKLQLYKNLSVYPDQAVLTELVHSTLSSEQCENKICLFFLSGGINKKSQQIQVLPTV
jgi:hypothetical protein